MKPIHIFDIENYMVEYDNLFKHITDNHSITLNCNYLTLGSAPLSAASPFYPYANLPIKDACSCAQRLVHVSKDRIWNCGSVPMQTACSFYKPDMYLISDKTFIDLAGKELHYSLIRCRLSSSYLYFVYSKTEREVKNYYSVPFETQENTSDFVGLQIFEQIMSEIHNNIVSSFKDTLADANKEEDFSVSIKTKNNSFLLSLVSVD